MNVMVGQSANHVQRWVRFAVLCSATENSYHLPSDPIRLTCDMSIRAKESPILRICTGCRFHGSHWFQKQTHNISTDFSAASSACRSTCYPCPPSHKNLFVALLVPAAYHHAIPIVWPSSYLHASFTTSKLGPGLLSTEQPHCRAARGQGGGGGGGQRKKRSAVADVYLNIWVCIIQKLCLLAFEAN